MKLNEDEKIYKKSLTENFYIAPNKTKEKIDNNDNINLDLDKKSDSTIFDLDKVELQISKFKGIGIHPEKKNLGFWGKISNKFTNIKNDFKYNFIASFWPGINFSDHPIVQIFDRIYETTIEIEQIEQDLLLIPYMTYRSKFPPIKGENKLYTSDCGWGCMIRAAQMQLAKALYDLRLHQFCKNKNVKNNKLKFKQRLLIFVECILLFIDIPLKLFEILEINSFKIMLDVLGLKNQNSKEEITPPFSISNVCQLGKFYGKGAGIWFSNVEMINIFCDIIQDLNPEKLQIISFLEGVVYENEIIESCFEREDCVCEEEEEICSNCIKYKGACWKFHSSGVVMISVVLGIKSIHPKYVQPIKSVFNVPNNIGIIGGQGKNANYFIGVINDSFVYLDPHLNQNCVSQKKSIGNIAYETYISKQFYSVKIDSMTPAMSIGFAFHNASQFKILKKWLYKLSQNSVSLFSVKEENLNKFQKYNSKGSLEFKEKSTFSSPSLENVELSNKKEENEENIDDDFLIV